MSADLAVQKAIRARLVATGAVTALVPAASILDRNERPVPVPSIILGEAQVVDEGESVARKRQRVYHTLHVWKREEGLTGVKAIAGAIRTALHSARLTLDAGYYSADGYVSGQRFLRDLDGATSHGILTVEVLVQETA